MVSEINRNDMDKEAIKKINDKKKKLINDKRTVKK